MSFIDEIRAVESFTQLPRARRNLVVYSEGPEYWPHLRGVLRELLHRHYCPFVYITSSANDPGLQLRAPLARTFNVGAGGGRKNLFSDIEADIVALTMPDLDQLTLKKSKLCGEYIYIFHSPVSTHLIYRDGAFDHYDTVFCIGPHHETEIRAREKQKGLPVKRLVQHGYGRLDEILSDAPPAEKRGGETKHVLVAPSWGANGLFETMGAEIVKRLLDAGFKVTARPHPQTQRLAAGKIDALEQAFGENPRFTLETDMADKSSFFESDIAISDWSGAAFDYAFSRLRPVVFIDTPMKMNNPSYTELGVEPMEAAIRSRIGVIVSPAELDRLPQEIQTLLDSATSMRDAIAQERAQWIYNVGGSARVAAAELARLVFNASLAEEGDPADLKMRSKTAIVEMLNATASDSAEDRGSLHGYLSKLVDTPNPAASDFVKLEALCRRIDIFKKLHARYDEAFAKPAGAKEEAGREAYPALAFCLINVALEEGAADRGLSLKYLNAAGNALAVYEEKGGVRAAVALESLLMRALGNVGAAS